jgi:hypothetical protein
MLIAVGPQVTLDATSLQHVRACVGSTEKLYSSPFFATCPYLKLRFLIVG